MVRIYLICKIAVISVAVSLISNKVTAQNHLDSVLIKFDNYRRTNPQEKIFVHTDQELYLTGETLWFKVYYVDGALHLPSDLSKVAYVEVLDNANHVLLQTKIALVNGEGHGTFFLPASITTGNYHLRAYTQWMKNFSPDFFFHKTVSIINTFRKLETDEPKNVQPVLAQFFPEGGDLVYGLKSKVAFQVTNNHGQGIPFSGLVLNEQNDTLASILPLKFGIGNFSFTPVAGSSYRAIISDTLGKLQTFKLPTPKSRGYVMEVRDTSDLLMINVSWLDPSKTTSTIYFVIHSRQIISATGSVSLGAEKATILIPREQIGEGISHITIFDNDLRPQCERLYFKQVKKKLLISTQTTQNEYGIRRKVTVDISVNNAEAAGASSLSVAVVKKDSLQANFGGNIFNYLWLTSDLKGEVESPEYYTSTDNHDVKAALDNLMLSHGWRRFNWEDVLTGNTKEPLFIPEYRGHLIRGTVLDKDGKPLARIPTFLSSPSKIIQLYTARSKSNGEVQFEMKDFWGSRKIIVQTNSEQDSTTQIKIQNPYSTAYAIRKSPLVLLQPDIANNLLRRSVAMQVQDIYYGENGVKFNDLAIDSTAFYGKANETYFLDDYTRFTVMEEVMREYVPGVMVRKRRDGFHFLVLDNVRKSLFQDNPLIILDGVPIFDVDKIMEFDPLQVKKLDVLTSRYFLGPLIFPGVVSYSTYSGDLGGFQLDPKSVSMDYEGLQRQRIFYSPQYENEKQRETRLPDRRNLLFWAPQVTMNEDGKQRLEFFTSDLTGDYTVIVEGLTEKGYSGSAVGSFKVKQFNN